MASEVEVANDGLGRLVNLSGVDHGFYILAIHAFIEGHVKSRVPHRSFADYSDIAKVFVEDLCRRSGGFQPLNMWSRLTWSHGWANKVRHEYLFVEEAIAKATTADFIQCLRQAGIGTEGQRQEISNVLKEWAERKPPAEAHQLLKRQERELTELRGRESEFTGQMEDFRKYKAEVADLNLQIRRKDLDLEAAKSTAARRNDVIDNLRGERNVLERQLKEKTADEKRFKSLEKYLDYLGKFSAYSRSRLDYERNLRRLAPEQEMVLRKIKPGEDVLIKGGAGTGKSLVLIHAMKKTLGHGDQLTWADGTLQLLFLTYTNVLVKYDHYLADTLSESPHQVGFRTVDSFIQDSLLPALLPGTQICFGRNPILPELLAACPLEKPLQDRALESELENFLFGQGITREEYLDRMIERKGMQKALPKKDREQVWAIRDWMAVEMDRRGKFTRMYGRWALLEALAAKGFPPSLPRPDIIFIDEVQDLMALDLRLLKAVAGRCLVMAGDFDQTIFTPSSPFVRAGIDISRKTHLLKANFRNTLAVGALAEAYRNASPGGSHDRETVPTVFREGPRPERFKARDEGALAQLLVQRMEIYHGELGYEWGSIGVLAWSKKELEHLTAAMTGAGIPHVMANDKDFVFSDHSRVRLSTLHSSKGLDFPVVMLYLPRIERFGYFEETHADRMLHNLVYVSLTRATDNLNVFLLDHPVHQALQTLDRVFDETRAGG